MVVIIYLSQVINKHITNSRRRTLLIYSSLNWITFFLDLVYFNKAQTISVVLMQLIDNAEYDWLARW